MNTETDRTHEMQLEPELDLNHPFRSRLVSMDSFEPTATGRGVTIRGRRARRFDRHDSTGLEGIFGDGPAATEGGEQLESYALRFEFVRTDLVRVTLNANLTDALPLGMGAPAPVVEEDGLTALADPAGMPEVEFSATAEELVLRCDRTRLRFSVPALTWRIDRDGYDVVAETSSASSVYWGYFSFPSGTIERDGRTYTTTSIARRRDEDYYGLGEHFTDLNKRRQRIDLFNRDPANTLANRTYITVPFFMSTGGYGVLVNSHAPATIDLGSTTNQAVGIEMEGDVLDYFVLLGTPSETLALYHRMTGPAVVPPLWSFGLWLSTIRRYRSDRALMEVADEIRTRGFPCDVLHVDPPWMGTDLTCNLAWGADFERKDEMIAHLRERQLRLCLWISPYVPVGSALHAEGLEKGFFLRDAKRGIIVNPGTMNFWSVPFVYVDFTRPDEVEWIKGHYQRLFSDGVSVLKVDLGELGPDEASYHNGLVGREGHNYYALAYQRTVFEATHAAHGDQALIWCRSGGAGSQRYPVHWAGDVACDFENMAAQLRAILSAGMSGFVFFSHDIGGFTGRPTPELYARWFQFAMFTSHTRAHGGEPHEPWEYGEEVESICRRFAELRYSLLPHIFAAAHQAVRRGEPLVKPLVFDYPDDLNVRNVDDEYLFCDSFLVAPMFRDRGTRSVYLPAGVWWDFWTGDRVESPGEWRTVSCELGELPVWVRDGSLVLRCEPGDHVDPTGMTTSLSVVAYGRTSGDSQDIVLPDGRRAIMVVDAERSIATVTGEGLSLRLGVGPIWLQR